MPPFSSTSKAVGSLISRRIRITHFIRNANNGGCSRSSDQIRCVSTISGTETLSSHPLLASPKEDSFVPSNKISDRYTLQKRRFLGCGDGEKGGALSKVHEEKIIMGYSPEQLFDVVAAVDLYHGFVPWCQRSDIVKQYPNGSFDAELEIGFKFLVESYVSRVVLSRPKFVKSTVSESTLFDHLINIWEFNPGPVLGTCNLHFLVDFKFQSPLYQQKLGVDEVTYIIDLKKGDVIKGEYEGGKPDVIFSFKDDDFLEIATGKMNPQVAFMRIKGSLSLAQKFTPDISQSLQRCELR